MKPTGTKQGGIEPSSKGLNQNFFSVSVSKGQLLAKNPSKERINTSGIKKIKTNASVKSFGGNVISSQIGKVRVSSGGRTQPGVTTQPERHLKYLKDNDKVIRKSSGGSHSRNQIFQMQGGSQTGRSYNKSNTREYSPTNISKSPKHQAKKSRNNRIGGSQTHVAAKRRPSKKYSKEIEAYKTMKSTDKSKKDSIFLMYQQYPRMTKTGQIPQHSSGQFSALSPKTVKNMMKSSSSGIVGFEKYQMKANPSKHADMRTSNDRKMASYLHSLASDGSKSKEDLRYVPVENISLFDDTHAPLSARNPKTSGGLNPSQYVNLSASLKAIPFVRNFKFLMVFKKWAAY